VKNLTPAISSRNSSMTDIGNLFLIVAEFNFL
jgi:hypothetical protein